MVDVTSLWPRPGLRVAWQSGAAAPAAADHLLLDVVAEFLGSDEGDMRIGRRCPRCGSSAHGRPVVLGRPGVRAPHVSLSRAPGVVLVAMSCDGPVGIDVERYDAAGLPTMPESMLHGRERSRTVEQRTIVWVRKESLLKATGDGLRTDPRLIRVSEPEDDPHVLEWDGSSEVSPTWMQDLSIDGYAACVAVLGQPSPVTQPTAAPEAPPG